MSYTRRLLYFFSFVSCLLLLSGCSESNYLLQVVKGQLDLMSRAKPIEEILTQETEPQHVRDQLNKVVKMRAFAVNSLRLPDSGSYLKYADLERPYVVWNLVAAPELSLELNQWCFPVTGCITYRGYFDELSAQTMAQKLIAQGFDVDVYGVQAYSTLNWFDDPVLNTFLTNDDGRLAALLFHEMSHQVIYLQDDTAFNESFAKTVEVEGLRRWLQEADSLDLWQKFLQQEGQSAEFHKLLGSIRSELSLIYNSEYDNDQKRLEKERTLVQGYTEYEHLKKEWGDSEGFDQWMEGGLNNARLSSMATYYELVPAFQTLLRQVDYDLDKFYAKVKALAALPKDDRSDKLKSLMTTVHTSLN